MKASEMKPSMFATEKDLLKAKCKAYEADTKEKAAHISRLYEVLVMWDNVECQEDAVLCDMHLTTILKETPKQSLQSIKDKCYEEAADLCQINAKYFLDSFEDLPKREKTVAKVSFTQGEVWALNSAAEEIRKLKGG